LAANFEVPVVESQNAVIIDQIIGQETTEEEKVDPDQKVDQGVTQEVNLQKGGVTVTEIVADHHAVQEEKEVTVGLKTDQIEEEDKLKLI